MTLTVTSNPTLLNTAEPPTTVAVRMVTPEELKQAAGGALLIALLLPAVQKG